jgi:ankyrin repeat protein
MNLPPPQDNDMIITQFKPADDQWELSEENIKRIDPKNGATILHNYCRSINTTPLGVYRYLIETKGCDINIQDNYNDTPPFDAIRFFNPRYGGNINVLTYLLGQKDLNAGINGHHGYTLLHLSCLNINILPLDLFKLLIETKGCDINTPDNNNNTPLHCAFRDFSSFRGGDISVLTYLLGQEDFNVNIRGSHGRTLLHWACQNINQLTINVFKLLIETHGIDLNLQDDHHNPPLFCAIRDFNPEAGGDVAILTYLISLDSVSINTIGYAGRTLLHRACLQIDKLPLDIFKLLIEIKGGDVNAQDNNNDTPIHIALCSFDSDEDSDVNTLIYLLGLDCVNVNTKNNSGHTLIHSACSHINDLPLDVFKFLIESKGADLHVINKLGNTPIHNALEVFHTHYGDGAILSYLLSQDCVNVKNINGDTILHTACQNINHLPLDIFKCLIETIGCGANAQDSTGNTPLHCAFRAFNLNSSGDVDVLIYLLNQKDVNVNIKGQSGETLLHLACINSPRSSKDQDSPKADAFSCQFAEIITERYLQHFFNDVAP